jgi:hypothetical protein
MIAIRNRPRTPFDQSDLDRFHQFCACLGGFQADASAAPMLTTQAAGKQARTTTTCAARWPTTSPSSQATDCGTQSPCHMGGSKR